MTNILYSVDIDNFLLNKFIKKKKDFLKDFIEFIRFKTNKLEEFENKKTLINNEFEIINWFLYKYNNLLTFDVCKLRNLETQKNIYLMFIKKFYKIVSDKDLKNIEINKICKNKIYNIEIKEKQNANEISVKHYKKFINFNKFIEKLENIKKTNYENKIKTFYIIKSDFKLKFKTTCINNFKDISFFYLEYNIDPSGFYKIENLKGKKYHSNYEEIYFIKDKYINKCFEKQIKPVNNLKSVLSFDTESRIDVYDIESEKNIMTHCGLEFYYKDSFNVCLINLEYYISCELEKNKSKIDDVYNKIIKKEIDIENEIKILKKKFFILSEFKDNKEYYINIFKKNKYVFIKELDMINLIFKLFYLLEPDYVLTYNGNIYDYQRLIKRKYELENKQINIIGEVFYTLNKKPILNRYQISENKTTKFNITNIFIDAPYILIDILNYIKLFNNNLSSFKLENVSYNFFNLKFKIEKFLNNKNIYYILYPLEKNNEKIKIFYKVLLTSSFCYINNKAYTIFDKTNIIKKNTSIYDVDLDNIKEKSFIITDNSGTNDLKEKEVVYLSKDDLLLNNDIFINENIFKISDYCIHDSMLCRYLYDIFYINFKISSFTKYYLLPQHLCFSYRNSTNFLGQLLKSLLENKSFLIDTKKIKTGLSTGGKVLEPLKTLIKKPILLLDFRSLYPSIIINYNISPDCLELVLHLKCKIEFLIAKNIIEKNFSTESFTLVFNDKEDNYLIMVFNKKKEGILSGILKRLLDERKFYKNLMKNTEENFLKSNYDILQNTIKILSNSVYGFLGSEFSILSCNFSSQSVTNIGSNSLIFTKDILDKSIIENKKMILNKDLEYNFITKEIIKNKKDYEFDFEFDKTIELEVIYGDTDSLFICVNNLDLDDELTLVNYLSFLGHSLVNFLHKNFLKDKLIIEFEDIMFKTIIIAKKKYKCIKIKPLNVYNKEMFKSNISLEKISYNSGISLKRRDNCIYQKKIINEVFNKIENNLDLRNKIDIDIFNEIKTYLYKEISFLINNLIFKKIKISDFIISMFYKGDYKLKTNPISELLYEYNKNKSEKISKGDRFNFYYIKKINDIEKYNKYIEITNLYESKKNMIDENTKLFYKNEIKNKIFYFIEWDFIEDGINNYIEICNNNIETMDDLLNNKKRIYIEIYIRKIIKDILTIFKNKIEIKNFVKNLINNLKLLNKTKLEKNIEECIEKISKY